MKSRPPSVFLSPTPSEWRVVGGGREKNILNKNLRSPTDAPIAVLTHRPVTFVSRTQTRATSMKFSNYIDGISGSWSRERYIVLF